MKISERTISRLAEVITGNSKISPYRTGSELIKFFNELGENDVYNSTQFGSRVPFTETKIREFNGTPKLGQLFRSALDPRNFFGTEYDIEKVVESLNEYLKFDGYKIIKNGDFYGIRYEGVTTVSLNLPFQDSTEINHLFMEEQIHKCDRKIREGDFDGAITNARSLLEAVLLYVEKKLNQSPPEYDGKLPKLYGRVQKLLNLDPSRKDIPESLTQMLQGLTSIVSGLAGVSNMMADRHARKYQPAKHHAVVSVNASKTVADFIFETFSYQSSKGSIGLQITQTISADEAADSGISKS